MSLDFHVCISVYQTNYYRKLNLRRVLFLWTRKLETDIRVLISLGTILKCIAFNLISQIITNAVL